MELESQYHILFQTTTITSPNFNSKLPIFKMFKLLAVLCLVLAVAFAAPQYLSLLDNEAAKQAGLPYSSGWTDGPNNGVGPLIAYSAYSPYYGHFGARHIVL